MEAAAEAPEAEQNYLDAALGSYEASRGFWAEGSPEKAIEALDQAYMDVLQVDADDDPDLIQQVEDLRFMISKRILEVYASRFTVANGTHKPIPLVMNEHVEKEIKLFQGKERDFFRESFRRSGRYRPMIVEALKEAGLPEDLSWLPLIESGYKVRALSRARALGLWQFIPSTGYKFGLDRNSWVDDRLDPEKSTRGAIAYLKELHSIFGDWTTSLAAYNCGEGLVLRRIRDQKINYLDDFWDLYQQLPRETARYVPRFLAALHILKDPGKYGMDLGEPDPLLEYELVTIEKQVQLKDIAEKIGVSSDTMKDLNPELRHRATPPKPYELKVPKDGGFGERLLASIDDIPTWEIPELSFAWHRVRSGETLSTIARKYRTSVQAIVRVNNLRSQHFIRIGQKLKIPGRGGGTSGGEQLASNGTYAVKKGDSLWLIARKFNMSPKEIQRMNHGIDPDRIYIGQVLKIRTM